MMDIDGPAGTIDLAQGLGYHSLVDVRQEKTTKKTSHTPPPLVHPRAFLTVQLQHRLVEQQELVHQRAGVGQQAVGRVKGLDIA